MYLASMNHTYHTRIRIREYCNPSSMVMYSLFTIKVFFFEVPKKVKVKSVKKREHKNVLITFVFVCIRMKKNVCQCIRVYYVL